MRKLLCLILVICSLQSITGCSQTDSVPENLIKVYYRTEKPAYGTEDGLIAATYMDAEGYESDYIKLLDQYLGSSPGEGFADTFPSGVSLVSFQLEALTAKVVLNSHIAHHSGMDLTIALACLTRTIMSLTGCEEVIISAGDTLLNGESFITLNLDSFLLIDNSGGEQN
jgi:hypothetical protein